MEPGERSKKKPVGLEKTNDQLCGINRADRIDTERPGKRRSPERGGSAARLPGGEQGCRLLLQPRLLKTPSPGAGESYSFPSF